MKLFGLINAIIFGVLFSLVHPLPTYGQTRFFTSSDSVMIAYEAYGHGSSALIFVHGWSCDRNYWEGQLIPFSQDFKVVAIDLAGHGESGLDRRKWTIETLGSDVAAVIQELDLQRVVLIGHSMGSCVIAEAARQLPGRVAGLVFVDQYKNLGSGLSHEEVEAFAGRLQINFKDSVAAFVRRLFISTSDRALVEKVAIDMSSAPPAIALDALVSTLNYSRQMPLTLAELQLPVIAINDTRRPTDVGSLEKYGVQVMIMPGVGHFLMMEDPIAFNELLRTAISKFVSESPGKD